MDRPVVLQGRCSKCHRSVATAYDGIVADRREAAEQALRDFWPSVHGRETGCDGALVIGEPLSA